MKPAIVLLLLSVSLTFAQDTPVAARDRAKRQLAVRAAARRIADTLQSQTGFGADEIRQLVAELGERMQGDVKAHADPDVSRALCVKILSDQRSRAIDEWIDEAVSRAREHTALPLSKEDVLRHVGADWNERIDTEAQRFADKHIEAVFGRARKQSVAVQRDEVKGLVQMPAEVELNARLDKLAESSGHHPPTFADLDALTDWLAGFGVAADRPLFQEVQHSTREASERIVQHVKQQYQSQLTALQKAAAALPPTVIAADSIRADLAEATLTVTKAMRLEEMRNRPDSRATVYGPLTVIQNETERMAAAIEEDRIAEAIRALTDLPIDAAAIESALRSDLKTHASQKDSRLLLIKHYIAELGPWFTARLSEQAARSNDEAFRRHLDELIVKSTRLTEAVNNHVAAAVDGVLSELRARVAEEQLMTVFGADPGTIEHLTPEYVYAIWTADRCATAKDFHQAWESLGTAGLLIDTTGEGSLIDEARDQIAAICNRLILPACRAMREQANSLAVLEQEWTAQLRKDVESGRSLEKITTDWTRELDRRWRAYAKKEGLPYADLFARTLDLLDKTVRKLFDSRKADMEKEAEAAEESPAEPPPETEIEETPPPEETPEESSSVAIEELLETLDFVLFFRDTADGRSEAVLLDGEGTSTRLVFDPGNVQDAVDTVYQAIIPAVEGATRSKATRQPKRTGILALFQRSRTLHLKIAVLVGSEHVRHMMSILLRNRVELFVADWNANPAKPQLELQWEDNLEVAP